jgi:alginate O-acetyltransferase complex protein AlgI
MLFNTYTFWVFYAAVLPLYWFLAQRHRQNQMLIVASYFFYGWWDWRFLPILLFSTIIDYRLGLLVHRASSQRSKRRLVAVSVCVNLLILGIFKYYNFFSHELFTAASAMGLHLSLPLIRVILPVGISFYTFQSMSYVWDIARGVTEPARDFWEFALYVCFSHIWSLVRSCDRATPRTERGS